MSQLRPIEEIQHAHDVLRMVFFDEKLRADLGGEMTEIIAFMGSVICWVLCHHEHQTLFSETVQVLEDALRRRGIPVVDTSRMNNSGKVS